VEKNLIEIIMFVHPRISARWKNIQYMANIQLQYSFIIILAILFLFCPIQAKTQKTMPGDVVIIASKILHENRTIYIHYPKPDTSNIHKRFPVLYLMDGESHFDMLAQYADYLGRWDVKVIPQMIVVGIANTKRTRDLTPTVSIINYFGKSDTSATSWMKPSGGNEEFLQFIHEELIPYIEANYRTQSYKILAGHSFGGIASINCLLTHPAMFDAYIAISPSFWWDREFVLKLADRTLQKGTVLNKKLFYSDADEGISDSGTFHTNLLRFDSLVTVKKINGLVHAYKYYPTETHMTEPVSAYYDALRFIFKDWKEN
jgi:predicted alpha/beta superfamily hydrolase